jgi:hypothetical protein
LTTEKRAQYIFIFRQAHFVVKPKLSTWNVFRDALKFRAKDAKSMETWSAVQIAFWAGPKMSVFGR